ncbi:MAG: EAL domain-containing protein [Candidatus Polarisedimenticolaceae bacterium]|nr:EAL domain-containing protein [Candidatus Polarisedimenticolaceae bacterium]
MKYLRSISLKLWIPLLVIGIFAMLLLIMVWMAQQNIASDINQRGLRLATQQMALLQREMVKEFGVGHQVEAGQALSASGVDIHYRTLAAIDAHGQIIHSIRFAQKGRQAAKVLSNFDTQRFATLRQSNRPDVRLETAQQQISAYFPLTLSSHEGDIRAMETGALFLIYDLHAEQEQAWSQAWFSTLPIWLLLLLAMALLVEFLRYFITRPIKMLVSAAQAVAQGDSGVMIHVQGSGELAQLANTFNRMSQQLDLRFKQRMQAESALKMSLDRLSAAQKMAKFGHYILDIKSDSWSASAELEQIFGVDENYKKNIDGWLQIIHPDFREIMSRYFHDEVLTQHQCFDKEYKIIQVKTGEVRWVHGLGELKFDDDNNAIEILGTIHDITQRKRAEEQIHTLSQAVEQSPVSVMLTTVKGHIVYVNSAFERVTGYSSAEVIGQNPRILKSGKTSPSQYHELWEALSQGREWHGEFQNRKKNGDYFWEHAHIAPVLDESGKVRHYLAVKEDITLRKQQEKRLLHQAHFDALTDLPNRFLSLDRLFQLLTEAKRNGHLVAVLFLDLDDFKKINDTLGHSVGDKILIGAAERLRHVIRDGDTVGRLGGDEFIVLLGGLSDISGIRPVVKGLIDHFRSPFQIDNRELILTVSIGIALYPNDGDTPSDLLRNADSAMYHSKALGRNTYSYFTDSMNQGAARRLALEEQMHGALDRGEFRLCYQPQIDVASRAMVGVEALIRWHNAVLGEVSPEEFIPIAEHSGLIVPIGQFVLTEALAMAAQWQKISNPSFSVAFNVSPHQFRDASLVPFIAGLIEQSGITKGSLELEITEGVLMSQHTYIDESLAALNDLGVKLAMDDFGTGYSSLSYLRNYPFSVLKIDRSFINDITLDEADLKLVTASIAMAHSLGLKVIAEGVEMESQLTLLAEQGCDVAQGFYFSKAVPADEITAMLEAG